MEEIGVVIRTDAIRAVVRVASKSACEHCTAGVCNMTSDGSEIDALNKASAKVGQKVRVELKEYTYVSGSLFFYGVPALALIAGAVLGVEFIAPLIGSKDPQGVSAVTAFTMLLLSFGVVKLWSRKAEKKSAYEPIVVEVLEE